MIDSLLKIFTVKTIIIFDGKEVFADLTIGQKKDFDIVPYHSLFYHKHKDLYPVVLSTGVVYFVEYDELNQYQKLSVIHKHSNIYKLTTELKGMVLKVDKSGILRFYNR
jgi:hypothetical protein